MSSICGSCGAPENAFHKDDCTRVRLFEPALSVPKHRVHENHDPDPGCREVFLEGNLWGECRIVNPRFLQPGAPGTPLSPDVETAVIPPPPTFDTDLSRALGEIGRMMSGRHKKYGPGNIAEFGPLGILVRLSDKFARLKNGRENFDDETVENTLDDIIGYALIWKLWLRGQWPGSLASGDSKSVE